MAFQQNSPFINDKKLTDQTTRCPHPGVPVNGRLLQERNFSVGAVVSFRCNPGYAMVGERRQTCLYFLQWSGNGAPKCISEF